MATTPRVPARASAAVLDALRSRLWPLPAAGIVVALVGAVALTALDRSADADLPPSFRSWVFGGDANAARSLLSSIATAMMTVTSLTFSLTVVTLQLASSQYSPRLLRTFTQAGYVQRTLALFLSTFVFTLTVLRSVRSGDSGGAEVVPRVAVTVTFVLTVASVLGLVGFLARLAESIRVETILETVHDEAVATARRTLTGLTTADGHVEVPKVRAVPLGAARSGFVTSVVTVHLVEIAQEHDLVVLVEASVGSSVVEGATAARVWSRRTNVVVDDEVRERLQATLDRDLGIGRERTAVDDVTFGLQQVTDVALKALSPGINDPTTAVHALGRSAALVSRLVELPLGDVLCHDSEGVRRLVVRQADVRDVLGIALDEARHYGVEDPLVVGRMLQLLTEVAESSGRADVHAAVSEQLEALVAARARVDDDPAVESSLQEAAARVRAALGDPHRR